MILLVIDMQKGLVCDELYDYKNFKDKVIKIVDTARNNNIEVIFFKHNAGINSGFTEGDLDFEIIDELTPKDNEKVYTKTINSCFGNQEFKNHMKTKDDKRIMIVGLQTNYCIDATVKSAFERGYEVIIPIGTNSTFDNSYMTGEVTVNYYNDDVWEGMVEKITFSKAISLLKKC